MHGGPTEAEIAVSKVFEKMAEEKGTLLTSIAYVLVQPKQLIDHDIADIVCRLAYVMHKTANVFPIVGGRKVEHLQGNIEALSVKLTDKDIEEIEGSYEFEHGFPMSFLFINSPVTGRASDMWINTMGGAYMDTPYRPKPIEPREKVES